MKFIVKKTRDSVCAGDDADAPHEFLQEVDGSITDTVQFVRLTTADYLASVNGRGHSWTAILNGSPIATVTPNDIRALTERIELAAENTLHFKYYSASF